jgi:hypothetical protein
LPLAVPGLSGTTAAADCLPAVQEVVHGDRAVAGDLFVTRDGRTVRLAGYIGGPGSQERLQQLVAGQKLGLRPLSRPLDRWGRTTGYVETSGAAPAQLAEVLIAEGLGHAAETGRPSCLDAPLAAEARARGAGLGIWSGSGTGIVSPADLDALTDRMGQHIVAEGRLASGRALRGRVYLNFARYWQSALSVVFSEADWAAMAPGVAPESLAGRRVRVRGWLEWRGGPSIQPDPSEPVEPIDGRPLATVER